jgi:hypothetical protein
MSDQPEVVEIETTEVGPDEPTPIPRRRPWRWIAAVIVAGLAFGGFGYGGYKLNQDDTKIKSLDSQVATLQTEVGSTAGVNATIHSLSQQIATMQTFTNLTNGNLNALSTQQRRDEDAMDIAAQSAFCAAQGVTEIADGRSPLPC